jgi:hypothetical protein
MCKEGTEARVCRKKTGPGSLGLRLCERKMVRIKLEWNLVPLVDV